MVINGGLDEPSCCHLNLSSSLYFPQAGGGSVDGEQQKWMVSMFGMMDEQRGTTASCKLNSAGIYSAHTPRSAFGLEAAGLGGERRRACGGRHYHTINITHLSIHWA